MESELKRPPRVPFDRPIRVVVVEGDSTGPAQRRMVAGNLSRGGMYIQGKNPPAQGSRLDLSLESTGGTVPLGEAEVVWARAESGCGVRFTTVGPNGEALLEALLKHGGTSSRSAPQLMQESLTPVVLEPPWEQKK